MAGDNIKLNIQGAANFTATTDSSAFKNAENAIGKVNTAAINAEKSAKNAGEALSQMGKGAAAGVKDAAVQADRIAKVVAQTSKLLSSAGQFQDSRAALANILNGQAQAASQSIATMNTYKQGLQGFTTAVSNAFIASGQTAKDYLQTVQSSMAARLTGVWAAMRYARQASEAMREMDLLRASMQRITGDQMATAQAMETAGDIAGKYSVRIQDVAKAMVELARQGRSLSDVTLLTTNLAEIRLLLATSTGQLMGMPDMIQHVTVLMNQLNVSAAEATQGLRLMAQLDIETAASFDRIGQALAKFAATGQMARMTMNEIILAASSFVEAGFTGEQAGTALNTILSRVGRNVEALAFMRNMGVELTTTVDGVFKVNNSFQMLIETYKKLKESGRFMEMREFLNMFAGTRMQSKLIAGIEQYIRQQDEGAYTAILDRGLSKDLAVLQQRQAAIQTMLDTIESKRVEVANAFNSVFIKPEFINFYKVFLDELVGIGKGFATGMTDAVRGVFGMLGVGDAERGLKALASIFQLYLMVKIPATVVSGLKYLTSSIALHIEEIATMFDRLRGIRFADSFGSGGAGMLTQSKQIALQISAITESIANLTSAMTKLKPNMAMTGLTGYWDQFQKTVSVYNARNFNTALLSPDKLLPAGISTQTARVGKAQIDQFYNSLQAAVQQRSAEFQQSIQRFMQLDPALGTKLAAELNALQDKTLASLADTRKYKVRMSGKGMDQLAQIVTSEFNPALDKMMQKAQLSLPPLETKDLLNSLKIAGQRIRVQITEFRDSFGTMIPSAPQLDKDLQRVAGAYGKLEKLMERTISRNGSLTEKQLSQFHNRLQTINQAYDQALQTTAKHSNTAILSVWGPETTQKLEAMKKQLASFQEVLNMPKVKQSAHIKTLQPMADELQNMIRQAELAQKQIEEMAKTGKYSLQQMGSQVSQVNKQIEATQGATRTMGEIFKNVAHSWGLSIMSWSSKLLNVIGVIGVVTTTVYLLKRAWDAVTESISNATTNLKEFDKWQQELEKYKTDLGERRTAVQEERTTLTAARTESFDSLIALMKRTLEVKTPDAPEIFKNFAQNADALDEATRLIELKFRGTAEEFDKVRTDFTARYGIGAEQIDAFLARFEQLPTDFAKDINKTKQVIVDFATTFTKIPASTFEDWWASKDTVLQTQSETFIAAMGQLFTSFANKLPAVRAAMAVMETQSKFLQDNAEKINTTYEALKPVDPQQVINIVDMFKSFSEGAKTVQDIQDKIGGARITDFGKTPEFKGLKPYLDLFDKMLAEHKGDADASVILSAISSAVKESSKALQEQTPAQFTALVTTFTAGMQQALIRFFARLGATGSESEALDAFISKQWGGINTLFGQGEEVTQKATDALMGSLKQLAEVEKVTRELEADKKQLSGSDSVKTGLDTLVEVLQDRAESLDVQQAEEEANFRKRQIALNDFTESYKPSPELAKAWLDLAADIATKIAELNLKATAGTITIDDAKTLDELKKKWAESIQNASTIAKANRPERTRTAKDPSRDMLQMVKDEYEAAKAAIEAQFQYREDAAGKILDLQDRTKTPEAFKEHVKNIESYIKALEKLTARGDAAFKSKVSKELERAKLERKKSIFQMEKAQLDIVNDATLIKIDLLNEKLRETKDILTVDARSSIMSELLSLNLQTTANQLRVAGNGTSAYQAVMQMFTRLEEAEKSANLPAAERIKIYDQINNELVLMLEGLSKITDGSVDPALVQALQKLLGLVRQIKTEAEEGIFAKSKIALEIATTMAGAGDEYANNSMTRSLEKTITGSAEIIEKRLSELQQDQDRLLQKVIDTLPANFNPEDEKHVATALERLIEVTSMGIEREMSLMQSIADAGGSPLMSSGDIQAYAKEALSPEGIQRMVQQYLQRAMDMLREAGATDEMLASIDVSKMTAILTEIVTKKVQQMVDNLEQAQKELMEAIQAGWEEGFNIGFEQGFTEEGYKALKDTIIRKIGQFVSQTLSKLISEAIADALADAFSGLGGLGGGFGKALAGLVGNIFGSLIGFLIGGFFNQFREAAESLADQQRKSQKDRVTASGFDWSYREAEKATPYYEFSPPVTQESVKIVKFVNNFSITTDAAMAMIGQQRELERIIQEIVTNMNRTLAKTVGVVI